MRCATREERAYEADTAVDERRDDQRIESKLRNDFHATTLRSPPAGAGARRYDWCVNGIWCPGPPDPPRSARRARTNQPPARNSTKSIGSVTHNSTR